MSGSASFQGMSLARLFKQGFAVLYSETWRSLWQTDPSAQVLETRVRVQAVEFLVGGNEG